jgi:hypothetical protein
MYVLGGLQSKQWYRLSEVRRHIVFFVVQCCLKSPRLKSTPRQFNFSLSDVFKQ